MSYSSRALVIDVLDHATFGERLALAKIYNEQRTELLTSEKLADAILRAGGNTLANTLRGHGIPYTELLSDVAKSLKIKHIPHDTLTASGLTISEMDARALNQVIEKYVSNAWKIQIDAYILQQENLIVANARTRPSKTKSFLSLLNIGTSDDEKSLCAVLAIAKIRARAMSAKRAAAEKAAAEKAAAERSEKINNSIFLHINKDLQQTSTREKELKHIVTSRQIDRIIHFTPIENIPSILEHGILSRQEITKKSIRFTAPDALRLDNQTDKISTSIQFPNYRMFYRKRCDDTDKRWAVILLDPSIIWELDCQFYSTNASRQIFKNPARASNLQAPEAFEKMFYALSCRNEIPNSYPTDPQAEILVTGRISTRYINQIVFESFSDLTKAPYYDDAITFVNSDLFKPRQDYKFWQSIY